MDGFEWVRFLRQNRVFDSAKWEKWVRFAKKSSLFTPSSSLVGRLGHVCASVRRGRSGIPMGIGIARDYNATRAR